MRIEYTLRWVARVTLETTAPLSIGGGRSDGVSDVSVARDANGLPCVPGTAIAGVLRSAWRDHYGDDPADLFGGSQTHASRLTVSNGHIHNAADQPVDGLLFEQAALAQDPLLGPLLSDDLPHRDHVALDHRGSARALGKFDRTYVPPGHRFTFDLSLEARAAGDDERNEWRTLLALLASPGFRLGGATRRAYGGVAVQRIVAGEFDLATTDGRQAYAGLSSRLDRATNGLTPLELPLTVDATGAWEEISLHLRAEDFWRAGNGGSSFSVQSKTPDALPYSERRVAWVDGRGELRAESDIVLPGSAIKGALAHRMAFHVRRLAGDFSPPTGGKDATPPPGVVALFGRVNDDGGGQAGHLIVDDVRLPASGLQFAVIQHNSIDRFTGGVRRGALFSEELVAGGTLRLSLGIHRRAIVALAAPDRAAVIGALRATLDDLCAGRLALGAAQAKGHGFFTGTIAVAPPWLMENAQ